MTCLSVDEEETVVNNTQGFLLVWKPCALADLWELIAGEAVHFLPQKELILYRILRAKHVNCKLDFGMAGIRATVFSQKIK